MLAATVVATVAAVGHDRDEADARRAQVANPAIRALAGDLATSAASIEDLRAYFEASDGVTQGGFARFVSSSLARQPSLEYLAWTPSGEDGAAGPAMLERQPSAEGPTPVPLATPQERAAMLAARDSALPRMTAPIPGPDGGRRVAIVAPVYAPGAPLDTVAQRRAALTGFVSGETALDALSASAEGILPPGTRLTVRDGDQAVIGDGGGESVEGRIEVAGRTWDVAVAGIETDPPTLPIAVAVAGLLLAGIVAMLFLESSGRERRTRGELDRLQMRHDLILAAAGDGIVSVDRDGAIGFVNPAAASMLGWAPGEMTGRPVQEALEADLAAPLRDGEVTAGEQQMRRRDGSSFPGEFSTTPVAAGGEQLGAVLTFRDITARKRLETRTLASLAAAEELAAVDALTGLANHRTFHERLRTEVEQARRHERGLSLVVMDLDRFKRVNDAHGHQVGDQVLERAAEVLRDETRTGELVARVGGEEFAMLLPHADGAEAFRAAERIRRAVAAAPFPAVGSMTMSAGVADITQAADAESLYRLADGALYLAKHRGRDMVVRYSPEATDALPAREEAERMDRQQALVSVRLLARAVDARSPGTRRHSERVADLSAEIADALGWTPERAALLREAGLVHDVGKIGVSDGILFRPGPLTPEEFELVKEHAELGARIVREALTPEQASWVRGHHERWDGNGYPDGLTAEECPEGARIMALADAWDAMTSDRIHTSARLTEQDALTECRAHSGTQFWPPAVDALASILARP